MMSRRVHNFLLLKLKLIPTKKTSSSKAPPNCYVTKIRPPESIPNLENIMKVSFVLEKPLDDLKPYRRQHPNARYPCSRIVNISVPTSVKGDSFKKVYFLLIHLQFFMC